jgi:hypothetical protein
LVAGRHELDREVRDVAGDTEEERLEKIDEERIAGGAEVGTVPRGVVLAHDVFGLAGADDVARLEPDGLIAVGEGAERARRAGRGHAVDARDAAALEDALPRLADARGRHAEEAAVAAAEMVDRERRGCGTR